MRSANLACCLALVLFFSGTMRVDSAGPLQTSRQPALAEFGWSGRGLIVDQKLQTDHSKLGTLHLAAGDCGIDRRCPPSGEDHAALPKTVPIAQNVKGAPTVSPLEWNADPTCQSDSTAAWVAMATAIKPGTTIDIGHNCFLLGNVTLPQNVTVRGSMSYGDPFILAPAFDKIGKQTNLSGVQTDPYNWGGQIRRVRGTILRASNGNRFTGLVFIRAGLLPHGVTFPLQSAAQANALIANYGDAAITSDQASVEVDHSTFLGFDWSLYATNNFTPGTMVHAISSKVRFEHNLVDGTNGMFAGGSGDPHLINYNHVFPFLTISATGVGIGPGKQARPMQRSGVAFDLRGPDTGTRVSQNLSFGYAYGLRCIGCSAPLVAGNHFENIDQGSQTGLYLSGQGMQAHHNYIIGFKYGAYLDGLTAPGSTNRETNGPGSDEVSFVYNQIIAPGHAVSCLDQKGGWIDATGNMFQNCLTPIHVQSAASGGIYTRNRFVNATAPFSFFNASGAKVSSYAGTGTLIIRDNPGYNPVGPAGISPPPASGTTYQSGPSPETVYFSASGGISLVSQNGLQILPSPVAPNVMATFELGPNERLTPTYSGTATMKKMVH